MSKNNQSNKSGANYLSTLGSHAFSNNSHLIIPEKMVSISKFLIDENENQNENGKNIELIGTEKEKVKVKKVPNKNIDRCRPLIISKNEDKNSLLNINFLQRVHRYGNRDFVIKSNAKHLEDHIDQEGQKGQKEFCRLKPKELSNIHHKGLKSVGLTIPNDFKLPTNLDNFINSKESKTIRGYSNLNSYKNQNQNQNESKNNFLMKSNKLNTPLPLARELIEESQSNQRIMGQNKANNCNNCNNFNNFFLESNNEYNDKTLNTPIRNTSFSNSNSNFNFIEHIENKDKQISPLNEYSTITNTPLKGVMLNSVENSNNIILFNNNNNCNNNCNNKNAYSIEAWRNQYQNHKNSPDSYFVGKKIAKRFNDPGGLGINLNLKNPECNNEIKGFQNFQNIQNSHKIQNIQNQLIDDSFRRNMKLESGRFRNDAREKTPNKLIFGTKESDIESKPSSISNSSFGNPVFIQNKSLINTNLSQNFPNHERIIQLKEKIKNKQDLINDRIQTITDFIDIGKRHSKGFPDVDNANQIQIKEVKFH